MNLLRGRPATLIVGLCLLIARPLLASVDGGNDAGITPPRLSLSDGEVSFWRPGNEDWQEARANTPLAAGDALAVSPGGRLEIQIGGRAFLRASGGSEIQIEAHSPELLRFKVTSGRVSLDVRGLSDPLTIEIGTPNAAFTIADAGYYRFEVGGDLTRCITRRGGRAQVTTAAGESRSLGSDADARIESDAIVVSAADAETDAWDDWNRTRTDELLAGVSRHYVGDDVYGAEDLDRYGRWQVVPTYGRVWFPNVEPTWAPYSTGDWVWDSYYGWSWIDAAPWGWAPFHYGRWVYARNYWAWAPGPIVFRPAYAPALVAFFGGSGFSIGIGIGVPAVSWVALGWGEPCLPWWGPVGFAHRPWWGGWGGPHIINQTIIDNSTHVHIDNVNVFEHARNRRGVVAVARDRFGTSPVERVRLAKLDSEHLTPADQLLPRRPAALNRLPRSEQAGHSESVLTKQVVHAAPSSHRASSAAPANPSERLPDKQQRQDASFNTTAPQARRESVPPVGSRGGGSNEGWTSRLDPPPHDITTRSNVGAGTRTEQPIGARDANTRRLTSPAQRSLDSSYRSGAARRPGGGTSVGQESPPPAPWRGERQPQSLGQARGAAPVNRVERRVPPSLPVNEYDDARAGMRTRDDRAPYNAGSVSRVDSFPAASAPAPERMPRRPATAEQMPAFPAAPAPRVAAPSIPAQMQSAPTFEMRDRGSVPAASRFGGFATAAPQQSSGPAIGAGGDAGRGPRHVHHR